MRGLRVDAEPGGAVASPLDAHRELLARRAGRASPRRAARRRGRTSSTAAGRSSPRQRGDLVAGSVGEEVADADVEVPRPSPRGSISGCRPPGRVEDPQHRAALRRGRRRDDAGHAGGVPARRDADAAADVVVEGEELRLDDLVPVEHADDGEVRPVLALTDDERRGATGPAGRSPARAVRTPRSRSSSTTRWTVADASSTRRSATRSGVRRWRHSQQEARRGPSGERGQTVDGPRRSGSDPLWLPRPSGS